MPGIPHSFDFDEKVALVTGAGRGIGRSTALALAEFGAEVAVVSRTGSELQEVVQSLERRGRQGLGIPADLAEPDAPGQVVDACIRKFRRLDILVSNAGMVVRKPAEHTLPEDWDQILNPNLKALAELCRRAIPHLRQNPGACIVNMSSIVGLVGMPLRAAYAASKAAIVAYTRVLAKELASERIRVNAVQPGFIETSFVTPYLAENPGIKDNMLEHIPLGRVGLPDEVAWPIVFLASSAASYITGQTLIIDGGWTLF